MSLRLKTVTALAIAAASGPKRRVVAKIIAKLTEIKAFLGRGIVNESAIKISNAKKATSAQGSVSFVSRLTTSTANAAAYML